MVLDLLSKWHIFIDTLFENTIQKSRIKFQLKSNFWQFLKMLEIMLQHFWKMLEIHCIKNARNFKSTFDLRWAKGFIINHYHFLQLKISSMITSLHAKLTQKIALFFKILEQVMCICVSKNEIIF